MSQTQSVRSTRVLNENEMERLREARRENLRRSKEQQNRRQAESCLLYTSNSHAYIKIGAVAALFLILCGMIELLFHPYDKNATLFSYYVASSEHKNAGGFAGGCLIRLFCPLFGKIGAGVILVVLGIISIILITERSLLSPIGRKSKVAYEEAKRKLSLIHI